MTSPDWFLIGKILFHISVSCKLSCNECNECLKPGCFQVMGAQEGQGGVWVPRRKQETGERMGAETVFNTLSDN